MGENSEMSDEFKITDPRELRKRFNEMRHGRSLDDRRISALDAIVRNVETMADINGLSGEDRYTVLAWHLLHCAARLEAAVLDQAMLAPPPVIIQRGCLPGLQPWERERDGLKGESLPQGALSEKQSSSQ